VVGSSTQGFIARSKLISMMIVLVLLNSICCAPEQKSFVFSSFTLDASSQFKRNEFALFIFANAAKTLLIQ